MRLRWPVTFAVLTVTAAACAFWWPHVRDEAFIIFGNRDEAGAWYGFWSGFAGGVRVFEWPVIIGLLYWHHTCHVSSCILPGRHIVDGSRWCNHHHIAARQRLASTGSAHNLGQP
jgi:hypothetical protein